MEQRPNIVKLLKAVFEHPYSKNACFACAEELDRGNATEEHVFPKWLQQRYGLWDKTFALLNQTDFIYRSLRIPCCRNCNNERLAQLEEWIRSKVEAGYRECAVASEFPFFRWLAKIFLGVLYKEIHLLLDRREPQQGTILEPEFMRRFSLLHFWLQVASRYNESNFCPGSLFVFRAQVPDKIEDQFDFMDDPINGTICLRMGEVVLMADFNDGGAHKENDWDHYERYTKIALHPHQVRELFAMVVYRAKLLHLKSEVQFFGAGDHVGYLVSWKPTGKDGNLYNPWVIADYAAVISFYTHVPYDRVYFPEQDMHLTWLHDPEGNPVYWEYGKDFPITDPRLVKILESNKGIQTNGKPPSLMPELGSD